MRIVAAHGLLPWTAGFNCAVPAPHAGDMLRIALPALCATGLRRMCHTLSKPLRFR